jgi:hypothetical protein
MENRYDPQTGLLLATQGYLDKGYKYDPTTGAELNDGGLFSNLSGNDYIDGAMGLGQLGLGYMNFLSNKKVRNAQIKGLNQQIAESKYGVQAHKNFVGGTKKAFGA